MAVVREEGKVNRSKEGFCREECHSNPTNYVVPSLLGEGSRLSHANENFTSEITPYENFEAILVTRVTQHVASSLWLVAASRL